MYQTSVIIVQYFTELMAPYKAIDYEKYIPKEGGALLVMNHNSEWDVILIALSTGQYIDRRTWQMSKQSLFRYPIVNAWIRSHYAFPLKRGQHDVDSYNFGIKCLKEGDLVVVYPEGTTGTGGGVLLEGHTGAIRMAIEAQVPIIPIGITGTEDTYPKHAKMLNFFRGAIFKAGEPFMEHAQYFGKEMPDYDELKRLTDNMMKSIEDLMLYDTSDA